MIISVASGKGGTGKTLIATSLALSLVDEEQVQLLDCDVEEPNAHILLNPVITNREAVCIPVPKVDIKKCTFCRRCAEICAYHAIAVFPENVLTFSELCHGCGACTYLCPTKAISEELKEIGVIESGNAMGLEFSHGKLSVGEAMATPVIRKVKAKAKGKVESVKKVKTRWNRELGLIAYIHEVVHQLNDSLSTDIYLTYMMAGRPMEEIPKFALEKPVKAIVDYHTIHMSFPAINHRIASNRQGAALNVVDGWMNYAHKQIKAIHNKSPVRDEEYEDLAIFYYLGLVNIHYDKPVDRQSLTRFEKQFWPSLDDLLRRELTELTPPLTWGETLYYYLKDLDDRRSEPDVIRQRKTVWKYLFPQKEFYCLKCDRPFTVDSHHPGRLVCPRCRAAERKRREREQGNSLGR